MGLACVLAAGCLDSTPAPFMTGVEPASIPSGRSNVVFLLGVDFVNDPNVVVDSARNPDVDTLWTVRLDDVVIDKVKWIDTGTIRIIVPGDFAVGAYDVTLRSPAGRESRLPDGLMVFDPAHGGGVQPLRCTPGLRPLLVTTDQDELDANETASPPHAGAGLSLREAITLANQPGRDCITFAGSMVVEPASALPALGDAGTVLWGPGVVLNGQLLGDGVPLLAVGGSDIEIGGVELIDPVIRVGVGVRVEESGRDTTLRQILVSDHLLGIWDGGESTTIRDAQLTGNVVAVSLSGAHALVERATFFENEDALWVSGSDTRVQRCVLLDNTDRAIYLAGTGVELWHNTLSMNGDGIQTTTGVVGIDLRNNIVAYGTGGALRGPGWNGATHDYNLFYANPGGICPGCQAGSNEILADLRFEAPTSADDRDASLRADSPAVDAGTDLGLDLNGAAPGLFNGSAPDIGAFER